MTFEDFFRKCTSNDRCTAINNIPSSEAECVFEEANKNFSHQDYSSIVERIKEKHDHFSVRFCDVGFVGWNSRPYYPSGEDFNVTVAVDWSEFNEILNEKPIDLSALSSLL